MKRLCTLAVAALCAFAIAGCATPTRAHHEADRKFLDGAGKEWLRYVDADDRLSPDSKAARHADWDNFDLENRHALEGK